MNNVILNAKNEKVGLVLDFNDAPKSYASKATAMKAVQKFLACFEPSRKHSGHHVIIVKNDFGRFVPVFLGERALQGGIHFNFCVAG